MYTSYLRSRSLSQKEKKVVTLYETGEVLQVPNSSQVLRELPNKHFTRTCVSAAHDKQCCAWNHPGCGRRLSLMRTGPVHGAENALCENTRGHARGSRGENPRVCTGLGFAARWSFHMQLSQNMEKPTTDALASHLRTHTCTHTRTHPRTHTRYYKFLVFEYKAHPIPFTLYPRTISKSSKPGPSGPAGPSSLALSCACST